MDTQTAQRVKDLLSRSQRIAVAVGKTPTIDDMGAALALYLTLQGMGKNVSIVAPNEPLVEISNLVGINKVKTRFEGEGADLVVSFPYKEGEIEKVSYTIENGYLNIVVRAGEQGLNFVEQDVKYSRGGTGQLDALFTVGTPRLTDIQSIFSVDMLKDVTVINIDNNQDNQGYGDIVLVSNRFFSVSEQVTQLLLDMGTDVDIDAAQNLLDGIMFAAENFQSPRTGFLAFEMAGELMRQGAVRSSRAPQPARPFPQPAGASFPQPFNRQSGDQGGQSTRPQSQVQQQQPSRPQPFDGAQGRQQHGQDKRPQFDPQRRPQSPMGGGQDRQSGQQQPQQQRQPFDSNQVKQPQQRPQPQPAQSPVQQQQPPVVRQPADQGGQQNNSAQQTQQFEDLNPPSDWLTPKVYKGSSNV